MSLIKRTLGWATDPEKEKRVELLRNVPLFKGLGSKSLRKLLVELFEKDYEAGEVVFSQGDLGKAVYIIVEGTVRISQNDGANEKVLARLGAGSYFGEVALIDGSTRMATATTESRALLLILYKSYFDSLVGGRSMVSTRVLMNLLESMAGYLKSVGQYRKDERTDA